MEDVTSLVLKVESRQVRNAKRDLDGFTGSTNYAEKSTDRLSKSFSRLIAPIAGVVSVTAGLNKLVAITREFDILNAQLITATGSADGAAQAFEAIQDFATRTPYDLAQVTGAFVTLVNRGLDPSERSLTAWGDFAAAMGRNVEDVVRAVGQASVGEMETLKTLGVVARTQGDEISFQFRGVTTVVKREAGAIEEYLRDLAENNFAGAMAERVNTLDGAMSNLGDSWNKLWLGISRAGAGAAIEDTVRGAIDVLEELNALVASGELAGYVDVIFFKFQSLDQGVRNAVSNISWLISNAAEYWGSDGAGAVDFILDAFKNLPENVGALAKLVGVEIWGLVDYGTATAKALGSLFAGAFEFILDSAVTFGKAIGNALNPFSDATFKDTFAGGFEEALRELTARADKVFAEVDASARLRTAAKEEVITEILNERDAAIAAADAKIAASRAARQAYEEEAEARAKATDDRLAQFKVGGTEDEDPFAGTLADRDKAVERIRQQLLTEEEAIRESYDNRRQIVLDSTLTTEEEKQDILRRLDENYRSEIHEMEMNRWKTALSAFDDFQNNMLVLAKTGNKDLARVFKAAAIANAIVKTYESATSAYASLAPIPYVGPVLGAAAAAAAIAAGMANVQAIRNQSVGNYATGGIIPGNSFAGDRLTANVNSGEMVLNFPQQKKLFDLADGKQNGGQGGVNVTIINNGQPLQVERVERKESGELEIYVKAAKQSIAGDLMTGGGEINRALDMALARKGVA